MWNRFEEKIQLFFTHHSLAHPSIIYCSKSKKVVLSLRALKNQEQLLSPHNQDDQPYYLPLICLALFSKGLIFFLLVFFFFLNFSICVSVPEIEFLDMQLLKMTYSLHVKSCNIKGIKYQGCLVQIRIWTAQTYTLLFLSAMGLSRILHMKSSNYNWSYLYANCGL